MAKKKKKKVTKKGFSYSAELYGIILVLIAILGIGKYGPVGRIFASFGLFLVVFLFVAINTQIWSIVCDRWVYIINIAIHLIQWFWRSAMFTFAVILSAFHHLSSWCYVCFSHPLPHILHLPISKVL